MEVRFNALAEPASPSVARTRLLERLAQAPDLRCIVLHSPAGSGKTSLLTAWRRELVIAGTDVAWVGLGPDDDDPARFFDALLSALSKVDPSLVKDAAVLADRSSSEDEVETLVISLVRAAAAHPRELVIVLDDAHHLHDTRVLKGIELLLDYSPVKLRLAFSTRSALPVALGRLRAQRQLLELGLEELRFTPEESAQLVMGLLGTTSEREARRLHQQTDGWVTGLKVLCLDMRRGRRGGPVRDPQAFERYFEQEVLKQLPAQVVEFLLHCALPAHFNAELCAALLGSPADVAASEHHLRDLEQLGLFIMPAGSRYPDGWRRLHPLLRDVLATRLQALPVEQRRSLHAIAWRYFAELDMPHEAVQHALLAGAEEAAADLVELCGTKLFARGELQRLVSLVRMLPDATVHERPNLRLWLAWAQLYQQRLPECAQNIARLQIELSRQPPAVRDRLTLLRGLLAMQCDDTAGAMAVLPNLLTLTPDADGIVLSGRRCLLTWIHLYLGEFDKARQVQLEEPIPLVDGQPLHGTAIGLLAGRSLVGLTHAVQGQMIQAERIYRDVLFEAEHRGPSCADAGTLAAAFLGEVLYELNDTAAVLTLLEPRIELMEQVSIPDTRMRMMYVLTQARWLAGRPLDALDYLEQSLDYAERMGLDRILTYTLLLQLQFRLRQGDVAQARELLESMEVVDARHAAVQTGALAEIRVAVERARIRLWLHTGDLDLALVRLDALAELCQQRGRGRRVPGLKLQSACALRQLGRHDEARSQVRDALRLGHHLGLMRTLLDAHEDVPSLMREAVSDPALDSVLRFYAERLDAAAREPGADVFPGTSAASRPGIEVLSPREAEIAQLLCQNLSNKRIARALDLSLHTVKWHLKNVYLKLGASGRDEVLERIRS